MSINFNHVTNDISASSGSVTINGSVPGGGGGSSTLTISNKTGAYTVVAGDNGTIINCTSGTFTVALTAAATLGAGFNCWIWNTSNTATDVITIDPNSTETIDGAATLILRRGEGLSIVCDGTNWQTGDKKTMRVYAENITNGVTRPTASGVNAVVMGNGTASGTGSFALGFFSPVASATNSFAFGANSSSQGSQAVTGSGAMALGGSYASGTDSFAAAIANNTSTYGATGANSVAMGYQSKSSGANSSVALGINNVASGTSSVALGDTNTASAQYAAAIGSLNTASGAWSFAIGRYVSTQGISGKYAYGLGPLNNLGDAQFGALMLKKATTDATATVLTSTGGAASTTNQVILPDNSAYAFTGTIVARQKAANGTASAAWKVEGLIRREAGAGTTTLVASLVTPISNVPLWTLALSADTTNGGLAITATGAAATNIYWVATINTSEVTYA